MSGIPVPTRPAIARRKDGKEGDGRGDKVPWPLAGSDCLGQCVGQDPDQGYPEKEIEAEFARPRVIAGNSSASGPAAFPGNLESLPAFYTWQMRFWTNLAM